MIPIRGLQEISLEDERGAREMLGESRAKPDTPFGRRGQSLILAMGVMFLMVFIGGLFITLVARNISRAQRSGEVLSAQYLAEAAIRYADHQLTYSEEGADWRPVPTYPEVVRVLAAGQDPTSLSPPDRPDNTDPDYFWLMQGYSRYSYGKGRFLIRVTYEPRLDDAMSKFIKIESVGRIGEFIPEDPTTWGNQQPIRLRKELVAYKPIAITDYARFVTNKDRRPGAISLGTPEFITTFGQWYDSNSNGRRDLNEVEGGSIRVNGDLLWHGRNYIELAPERSTDVVEVAGDIRHSKRTSDANPGRESVAAVNGILTEQSSSPNFSTIPIPYPGAATSPEIGRYRDGRAETDSSRRPRGIYRLEPPILDIVGAGSRLSRYRELTRNSGEWKLDSYGEWYNSGYYGWGDGIYVANRRDVQIESVGYTLRGNWTQPGTEFWYGPYYVPPGVGIALYPYDLDNADGDNDFATGPDLVITRDERTRYIWRDEDGNPLPETGEQIVMPYPKNGVIFAEGNIRIKGTLPPGVQLTVVSGATIYIEGNVLKYPGGQPGQVKDSAVALLATDYVCVNTTQFLGPVKEVPFPGPGSSFFDISPTSSFWFGFSFGADPSQAYPQATPVALYVRHTAAQGGASYMNMLVNWPPSEAQLAADPFYSFYRFGIGPPWATTPGMEYIYPLADVGAWPDTPGRAAVQQYESWEHQVFTLLPDTYGGYVVHTNPGVENRIGFQLDQSSVLPVAPQDYYLSRAAIQPMDIRIEALTYAQNKSFFIIPGEWFNPDPDDTPDNLARRLTPAGGIDPGWPFYGQPLDVRITIYGAVSENLTAAIGDSSAWMEKWGWIPPRHGSSAEPEDETKSYRTPLDPAEPDGRQIGLTFIYDQLLSHPVAETAPGVFAPLRSDGYGRTLPIVPRLPVSPQLIYFGEPM